jgi:hypothetical protein
MRYHDDATVSPSHEQIMEAPWKPGDTVAAHCPNCRAAVQSRFELRVVHMPRTRLRLSNVLVSVCTICESLLGLPRQSLPALREISAGK